jgi:hypothetical protein
MNNQNGIAAFCGAKFSGKSTSGELVKRLLPGQTEELAFAGHLKKTCAKVFNIDIKYFLDPALKEVELDVYPVLTRENMIQIVEEFDLQYDFDKHLRPNMGKVSFTPRGLLQYVGTELLHPIDPLVHVKKTLKLKDPTKLSIVTDLRFPHEFEALKQMRQDFVPVYVDNKAAENAAAADSHASEQGWKVFKDRCIRVDNNSDMANLEAGIQNLVKSHL